MGQCQGSGMTESEKALNKASKEIDKYLKADGKYTSQEVKILLLGPGESGKSTVFKQCKIIQEDGGFSDEDRRAFISIINHNIISQMGVLVTQANKLGFPLEGESLAHAEAILSVPAGHGDTLNPTLVAAVKALWADPKIQSTYRLRDKKYSLNDSASYFFESIDRIAAPGFEPNNDDVLRARVRSTGIEEAEFQFKDLIFRMFDVGGQRSERRKWIHCFENVTAVLFVVSLCGYDQVLREDETQNCMKESLLLFDEIVNSPWFSNTNFILFLNKKDLFTTKILESPLEACFPDYKGGPDEAAAHKFIQTQFLDLKAAEGGSKEIFVHFTCAIDTKQIAVVFNSVRKTLLEETLGTLGVPLGN